jgi:hypothetical protein
MSTETRTQQTYIESVISKIVKNKHLWKTKQLFLRMLIHTITEQFSIEYEDL